MSLGIVLFGVLLVVALVDYSSVLTIITPAASLVVAANLLLASLCARRYYAPQR